uniref:Polysaccharide lyase 14 domain-containing protein n=1 Tax=Romanomermis culicivorax TaxID=13658 RepID=A0A915K2K4_ROMCU
MFAFIYVLCVFFSWSRFPVRCRPASDDDTDVISGSGQSTITFDKWRLNDHYTERMAKDDFGYVTKFDGEDRAIIATDQPIENRNDGDDDAAKEDDGDDGRSASIRNYYLRVELPADKVGPADSGVNFKFDLKPQPGYEMSYKIRFENDFDWVSGGMLPGLCNGDCDVMEHNTDGDGSTITTMWDRDGKLLVNLKQPGQSSEFGATTTTDYTFARNRWTDLKIRWVIWPVVDDDRGDFDNDDTGRRTEMLQGTIMIWADDDLVYERRKIPIIGNLKTIDKCHFSAFYDNRDQSDKPEVANYIGFDNVFIKKFEPSA